MREILKHEAPLPLSEGQIETFCRFGEALLEQNKVMNLTAITEPGAVARLHFVDCMALLPLADLRGKAVIDVGCGAGFPGVPLKIAEPSIRLTLLDSLGKRMRWLETVLPALGVDAEGGSSGGELVKMLGAGVDVLRRADVAGEKSFRDGATHAAKAEKADFHKGTSLKQFCFGDTIGFELADEGEQRV